MVLIESIIIKFPWIQSWVVGFVLNKNLNFGSKNNVCSSSDVLKGVILFGWSRNRKNTNIETETQILDALSRMIWCESENSFAPLSEM